MKPERTEVGLTGRYAWEITTATAQGRGYPRYTYWVYDTDDDRLVGFGSQSHALGLVDRLEQEHIEAEGETS